MTFWDAIRSLYAKGLTFKGRSTRSEYWYAWLFSLLVDMSPALALGNASLTLLLSLPVLATLVCLTSAKVRRLHDIGKSGWDLAKLYAGMVFFPLLGFAFALNSVMTPKAHPDPNQFPIAVIVMILGNLVPNIILLVYLCKPSDPGSNAYGRHPLAKAAPSNVGARRSTGVARGASGSR